QFQFHPRHRAGRRHSPRALRHRGASIGCSQDSSRVHCLCQGQSGQGHHGVGRYRSSLPCVGRTVQDGAGVNLVHVPYRGGGPAVTDLLGGQVQVMFAPTPPSIEHIRSGNVRALAVPTAPRLDALPDIPTVGEFVPGYEASNWYGVGIPKNTPVEIVDKLNKEINAGLAAPKMQARLADFGVTPLVVSPADFGRLIADETEKWGNVIRALNIKAD